ncbi:nicotinate-nucleotide pyrophosphorylase [carboxylating], chloroplastic isoform X1 [Selaginella moellendorffii]|uniref:nicotinate-nucleotide pyrophosphorylase [carboxylating], chloroplastic isoform X1 n=1 Tax=Selaginella moellendorffii TaxID=88036 RepID=UPI000D1CAF83|nr:nicotinate-nucleotide pyrophosphorylase [carboxylating], chloroplastic isoform X1 [Selaginella moellendorffii]|eukprot:XP_024516244.1 nicotinate-nucleotide pyrophosphorylase [carboxylating], chloroplastic isoform X1 [Selaginella moellendorffii]
MLRGYGVPALPRIAKGFSPGRSNSSGVSSSVGWRRQAMAGVSKSVNGAGAVPPPVHPTYNLREVIQLALSEDAGDRGDVSCLATIPAEMTAEARFLAKENGVIAGIALADMVFQELDPSLKTDWAVEDGSTVEKGQVFGKVCGNARSILTAERVVLNFMQRMSGIATATKKMADAAKPARILETRKTAPGLRLIDKWAVSDSKWIFSTVMGCSIQVLIGGGENHRMGLYDMVMVKDNHIAVAGGIENAIFAVTKYLEEKGLDIGVEVETRTLDEVRRVLAILDKGKVTRIMLDNMVSTQANGDIDVGLLREAVEIVGGRVQTEASGNVTLSTVGKIGSTGVTYISSGALTHSVSALDISCKVDIDLALAVGKRTNRA